MPPKRPPKTPAERQAKYRAKKRAQAENPDVRALFKSILSEPETARSVRQLIEQARDLSLTVPHTCPAVAFRTWSRFRM